MAKKTLITCDDFEQLALAGKVSPWAELVDGEILEPMSGGYEHSLVSSAIFRILDAHVRAHKRGRVLTNELGLHIHSDLPRSRGADVAFISFDRIPRGQRSAGFLRIAPELIVEVLGAHDTWASMEEKVSDYHRTGVELVWVVDPVTRAVRVLPRGAAPSLVYDGQTLDGGSVLPGFSVPVSQFFDEE